MDPGRLLSDSSEGPLYLHYCLKDYYPGCRRCVVTVDFASTPGRITSARIGPGQATKDFHRSGTAA
jgi:hypothetical protein